MSLEKSKVDVVDRWMGNRNLKNFHLTRACENRKTANEKNLTESFHFKMFNYLHRCDGAEIPKTEETSCVMLV